MYTFGKIFLVVLCSIFIVGCISPAPKITFSDEFVEEVSPTDGESKIYIYRPSAAAGSAVRYQVFIDNKPRGVLVNGSYLELEMISGTHEIAVKTKYGGIITQKTEFHDTPLILTMDIRPNDVQYYKLYKTATSGADVDGIFIRYSAVNSEDLPTVPIFALLLQPKKYLGEISKDKALEEMVGYRIAVEKSLSLDKETGI